MHNNVFFLIICVFLFLQYGSDEFPHDSPVAVARYASPKAGGTLYQQDPFYDPAGSTWYTSPSSAYAPQSSSAGAYHHVGHSPHLGPPHGHDHYSLSPGVTHMDGHLSQVCNDFFLYLEDKVKKNRSIFLTRTRPL